MTVDVDLANNFSSQARSKIFDNFFLENGHPKISISHVFIFFVHKNYFFRYYNHLHNANYERVY